MTDKKLLRVLFNNAVEDIKASKEVSFAAIARLSEITKDKANNIRNGRSTPNIDDIQKLLTAFPEFKSHFAEVEEIKKVEEEEDISYRKKLEELSEQLDRCTEERSTCTETVAAQKEEIRKLKEMVAIQNVLLDKHGIMRDKGD